MLQQEDQSLRLFLGIPIEGKIMEEVSQYREKVGEWEGLRWIAHENWHITVYFFGGMVKERLENLEALLELALGEQESFCLNFDGFSWGPGPRSPRMLWARFQKNEEFKSLVQRIHRLYLQVHPQQQMRKSPLPHITLARLKNFNQHEKIDLHATIEDKKFKVEELRLWKSILHPQGAEYKVIRRFLLS